jgi:hypothetical protein
MRDIVENTRTPWEELGLHSTDPDLNLKEALVVGEWVANGATSRFPNWVPPSCKERGCTLVVVDDPEIDGHRFFHGENKEATTIGPEFCHMNPRVEIVAKFLSLCRWVDKVHDHLDGKTPQPPEDYDEFADQPGA